MTDNPHLIRPDSEFWIVQWVHHHWSSLTWNYLDSDETMDKSRRAPSINTVSPTLHTFGVIKNHPVQWLPPLLQLPKQKVHIDLLTMRYTSVPGGIASTCPVCMPAWMNRKRNMQDAANIPMGIWRTNWTNLQERGCENSASSIEPMWSRRFIRATSRARDSDNRVLRARLLRGSSC